MAPRSTGICFNREGDPHLSPNHSEALLGYKESSGRCHYLGLSHMILNMKVLESEQGEDEENLLGVSYFSLPDMKKKLEHARGSISNLEWVNK